VYVLEREGRVPHRTMKAARASSCSADQSWWAQQRSVLHISMRGSFSDRSTTTAHSEREATGYEPFDSTTTASRARHAQRASKLIPPKIIMNTISGISDPILVYLKALNEV